MLKVLVALQNLLAEPLRRDDRGATAVEYGLIVALIAGVIVVAVTVMGTTISNAFQNVIKGF
jgi:pilus assembly protein Flp/PilA